MEVRPITESDIPKVAEAHSEAWKVAFKGILSDKLLSGLTKEKMEKAWEGILKRGNRENLVLVESGEVKGFVGYEIEVGEERKGEIIGIYVHPSRWNHGIGSTLMESCLNRMKEIGFEKVFLWTMSENFISRGFYKKAGFTDTERKRESEREGEIFEEIMFEKKILAEPVAGGDATRWRS
jgi:ribosomal protein S18 acetylase RimI-like enzyme